MVADIDLERAEVVAASCGAVAVAVDVCDTASVERMVATTVERFGRLDAVYHCAVDVPFVNTQDRRLTELDEDVWARMIDLCLTGVFRVVKHAGRQMLKQRSGSIILSSTVDALVGCAGLDSYTAAKGGVTALDPLARRGARARRHPRQRDRAELRLERAAEGLARGRRLARDDRAAAPPADPDARGDRAARRLSSRATSRGA